MNPFATAALLAIAQLSMAYMAIQPTPEQIHLLVLQQYCKEHTKKDPNESPRQGHSGQTTINYALPGSDQTTRTRRPTMPCFYVKMRDKSG